MKHDDESPLVIIKRMSKAPPAERVKLRAKLLGKMNGPLREWFDEIEQRIVNRVRDNLLFYWELGRDAAMVHGNENHYGADAITICTGCFQEDKSVLYKAMCFFRAYNAEELDHLLSLRMKDTGRPVMWSHIVVLVSVSNKSKRNQFLHKLMQNNWTDEELHRFIKQELGPNPMGRPGSGRKVKIPLTVDKMLHHMDLNLGPIEKKFTEVWNHEAHGLVRLIQNTDPEEYTAAMLLELDKTILTVESIAEGSKTQLKQLQLARKRVVASLQQRGQVAGVGEAEGLSGNGKTGNGKTGTGKTRAKKAEEELVPAAVE